MAVQLPGPGPELAVATTLHAAPSVYALLLGSGISRAAGILTGAEITAEIIRDVAALERADVGADPVAWYRTRFGVEPRYDDLLARLYPSSADRQARLRGFFEPTPEERAHQVKVPTAAHRAIAALMRRGVVHVVLTTNFDRLLELALQDQGIVPQVVASEDQAVGAVPVPHAPSTIVKLNGDYLDTRLRNTEVELAAYPDPLGQLVHRIFDEYGLVVCGWSATWDVGLRQLLDRVLTRRYTTFWAVRSAPDAVNAGLIARRQAVEVPITDADAFFTALDDQLKALDALRGSDQLAPRVAAARVKLYLDEQRPIPLEDLVRKEGTRLRDLYAAQFPLGSPQPTDPAVVDRVRSYEATVNPLLYMAVAGAAWANGDARLWSRVVSDLARKRSITPGVASYQLWQSLEHYSAMLVLHGAALAAFDRSDWKSLYTLLVSTETPFGNTRVSAAWGLTFAHVFNGSFERAHALIGGRAGYLSSVVLERVLRPALAEVHLIDNFDGELRRLEYFWALVCAAHGPEWNDWFPLSLGTHRASVGKTFRAEVEAAGEAWPALAAGFFDGKLQNAIAAMDFVHERLSKNHQYYEEFE